jgi:hypothetical protein
MFQVAFDVDEYTLSRLRLYEAAMCGLNMLLVIGLWTKQVRAVCV